jgi:hypothetical protein
MGSSTCFPSLFVMISLVLMASFDSLLIRQDVPASFLILKHTFL